MKRFSLGLLAAGMLAAASLVTSLPAAARGGGMIWIPPMGGGMGGGVGGWNGAPGSHGPGSGWRPPAGAWHAPNGGAWQSPGATNSYSGRPYNGKWPNGWNSNWYQNGHWYGPRYPHRHPGYPYYYGGFWYPWPWWTNVWNLEIGDNYGYYGYYGRGYHASVSRHVAWCQGRYRSYNPRTNTYTGYDGQKHRCNSPYD